MNLIEIGVTMFNCNIFNGAKRAVESINAGLVILSQLMVRKGNYSYMLRIVNKTSQNLIYTYIMQDIID